MPKVSIYLSRTDLAVIEAAAGKEETPYAYLKRVSISHAKGEWKASGVTEIRDAVDRLRDSVTTESKAAISPPGAADPDLALQVKRLTQALNLVAKVVLRLRDEQQQLLENNQTLSKSISEALL